MTIDFSTSHGQRALRQLQQERVVWLTTVGSTGTPQPNPVWFLYDGDDVLMYTNPNSVRIKNIARNPNVSLNFNTADDGEGVTVFTGTAKIDTSYPPVIDNSAYLEKYNQGIARLGSDPQTMSDEYSVVIRISLRALRGW